MIRATRTGFLELSLNRVASQKLDLSKVQNQAVTGLAFQRASEAPVAMAVAQGLNSVALDQDVYVANAASAVGPLTTADEALARVSDLMVRARELSVAMAGDTATADMRTIAAVEVRALGEELLGLANTRYGDRYLFSGTTWNTEPFAADGTYSGSTDEPEARVAESRYVRTAFDGSQVFNGAADVFASIDDLATALETNDATGIGTALTDVDNASRAIVNVRGEIGLETLAAQDAGELAESLGVVYNEHLSILVTADPVETYTRMNELQSAYEATLQVIASASSKSLLDYL